MTTLDAGRDAILDELDRLIDRVASASASDYASAVRCAGWCVADLLRHVARAPAAGAEGFRRMMAGVDERPPEPPEPPGEPDAIRAALREGRDDLRDAIAAVTEESLANAFPLFFITVPGVVAVPLMLTELGTHRNDLDWALGERAPLPPAVIEAGAFLAPLALLSAAGRAPERPPAALTYRLTGPSVSMAFTYDGSAWSTGGNGAPVCEIAGDDSSIVLFALGRIGADGPGVRIEGDPIAARRFKTFLPGP